MKQKKNKNNTQIYQFSEAFSLSFPVNQFTKYITEVLKIIVEKTKFADI